MPQQSDTIRWFEQLGSADIDQVGGKNASLGELLRHLGDAGVRVPGGFAITAAGYRSFLTDNQLDEQLRTHTQALASGERSLAQVGEAIRRAIRHGQLPEDLAGAIREAYAELSRRSGHEAVAVAVRSSATAEDLPEASFAGQQETYLNVRGADDLLAACRDCYASLFTDRAISYRRERGFDHLEVALSIGVQQMVRSDLGGAGVMFSLDTDSGFPRVVVINAAWGLGETVVQGQVDPDEYRVFKPGLARPQCVPILAKQLGAKAQQLIYATGGKRTTKLVDTPARRRRSFVLSDDEILTLARWAVAIEQHYGTAMDMEWAKDGESGELYCVQARPETVYSQQHDTRVRSYELRGHAEPLVSGAAIGQAIAVGRVRVLHDPSHIDRFERGDILVTERTDPDWGPLLKRAAAIVTDHGGRTSHAAIVSRELGIPAVVGCERATKRLRDGQLVTLSCAEGQRGHVYDGELEYDVREFDLAELPQPPVPILINLANPDAAFRWWRLPVRGVGLARMEFIINEAISIHPLALTRFEQLDDPEARARIEELTAGYADKTEFFVERLARGVATIAAAVHPHPAILRMSDFKTNEYAALIGGRQFEAVEANPMLGFRGAARYASEHYRDGFALECRAVERARELIGLDNLVIMIPFVRTVAEADRVIAALAEHDLVRGVNGLELYMMCELPANVFLVEDFAARFDGFSIGSNDLTQLILGIDRDSELLADEFDESNPAVLAAIRQVISRAHAVGCKVGICGQAPSDDPEFAQFLIEAGIDTISLNPDSVVDVILRLTGRST